MKKYNDIDNDSGVNSFEIGVDYIDVTFKDGSIYRYTHASAGKDNIERMKKLAESGDGLNAFINSNVRKKYARKIR